MEIPKYPAESVISVEASQFVERGFDKPIIVGDTARDALGLTVPGQKTTLNDVANIVGRDLPVKLIEVGTQSQFEGHTIGQFADYLEGYRAGAHKVLNMITLECSATPLSSHIQAPEAVREVDWIDQVWPLERRARGDYPSVQKYCLSGMAESYTDFHVDFGGTSVWYHVISGRKRFYLVPPTTTNLLAYAEWTKSSAAEDVFFGDTLLEAHKQQDNTSSSSSGSGDASSSPQMFQIDLLPGQTLMIPSAWIHAVYTPEDSLVFGGNFLHSGAILRQLQVFEVETRTRVGRQYRFPHFKELNAYLLASLLPYCEKRVPSLLAAGGDADDNKDNDDDDDDDDDEELESMAVALLQPTAFWQLPYLLRAMELWLDGVTTGPASATGAPVYPTQSAKSEAQVLRALINSGDFAGKYKSWPKLLQRWWTVCEKLAPSSKLEPRPVAAIQEENDDGEKREAQLAAMRALVPDVRRSVGLNMLDFHTVRFGFAGMLDTWPEPEPIDAAVHPGLIFAAIQQPMEGSEGEVVPEPPMAWVQCSACDKWRTLPPGTDITALPDKWQCSMNDSDPEYASCDAPEKEYVAPGSQSPENKKKKMSKTPTVVPVVEEREWVACDKCGKWRALPPGTDLDALPETWECSMNSFDPARASCDAAEEQTEESEPKIAVTAVATSPAPAHAVSNSSGLRLSLGAMKRAVVKAKEEAPKKEAEGEGDNGKEGEKKKEEGKGEDSKDKVKDEDEDDDEAVVTAADFADSDSDDEGGGEGKAPAVKKRVRLSMPARKKAAPKPRGPDIYAVSYDKLEEAAPAGSSSSSSSRFGTRGKKLSASYLRNNADVEVEADGTETTDSAGAAGAAGGDAVTFNASPGNKEGKTAEEWDEFEDGDDAEVNAEDFESDFSDEEEEEDDDFEDEALLEQREKQSARRPDKRKMSVPYRGGGGGSSAKRARRTGTAGEEATTAAAGGNIGTAFAARKFDAEESSLPPPPHPSAAATTGVSGAGPGKLMRSAAMLRAEAAARASGGAASAPTAALGAGTRKILPNNRANLLKIASRGQRR
jgi:hypothetical protein